MTADIRLPGLRAWAQTMVAVVSLFGAKVGADTTHFRPYLVGSRAAGMGGAFTALSDDSSGSYYNPGGLAFTRRSSVSLSASVYGLVQGRYENVVGPYDIDISNVNIFPVTTAGLWKLGEQDADGMTNHTLAFGVFLPNAVDLNDRTELNSSSNAIYLLNESQTLWAGLSYAYRYGRWGFGLSAFVMQGSDSGLVDIATEDPADRSSFLNVTGNVESTWYGGTVGFGARFNVTDAWSLGASVFTPAIGFGSKTTYARINYGAQGTDGLPQQFSAQEVGLDAKPDVPLRAQFGSAFRAGPVTLSADAIFLAPLRVVTNEGETGEDIMQRVAVLNGSFGAEVWIAERFPVRAGFFTDFSAAVDPDTNVGDDDAPSNTADINRYGVSFSVGHRGQHVTTDVGVNASLGRGREKMPKDLDLETMRPVNASQRLLYVFLATTYEF